MKDTTVLCGANSYEQKYYFNQDFKSLPQSIRDELQIMCVMYTEDVGGVLTMEFDERGNRGCSAGLTTIWIQGRFFRGLPWLR